MGICGFFLIFAVRNKYKWLMLEGYGLWVAAIALVKFVSLMFKEAGLSCSRPTDSFLWENEFWKELPLKFNSCKGYYCYVSRKGYDKKASEYVAFIKDYSNNFERVSAKTEAELVEKTNSRLEEWKQRPKMKMSR